MVHKLYGLILWYFYGVDLSFRAWPRSPFVLHWRKVIQSLCMNLNLNKFLWKKWLISYLREIFIEKGISHCHILIHVLFFKREWWRVESTIALVGCWKGVSPGPKPIAVSFCKPFVYFLVECSAFISDTCLKGHWGYIVGYIVGNCSILEQLFLVYCSNRTAEKRNLLQNIQNQIHII